MPNHAPEAASLPLLAKGLVALSLGADVRSEGLDAFEEEFQDAVATNGLKLARAWALKVALNVFLNRFAFDIAVIKVIAFILTLALAILGFVF